MFWKKKKQNLTSTKLNNWIKTRPILVLVLVKDTRVKIFGVLYILFSPVVPVLSVHNFIVPVPEQQISRAEEVTHTIIYFDFSCLYSWILRLRKKITGLVTKFNTIILPASIIKVHAPRPTQTLCIFNWIILN